MKIDLLRKVDKYLGPIICRVFLFLKKVFPKKQKNITLENACLIISYTINFAKHGMINIKKITKNFLIIF